MKIVNHEVQKEKAEVVRKSKVDRRNLDDSRLKPNHEALLGRTETESQRLEAASVLVLRVGPCTPKVQQNDETLIFHGIAVIQRDLADVETQRQRTKVCYTIQNYEQEPSGY